MRTTAMLYLAALALLAAPTLLAQEGDEPAEAQGVKWTEDYAEALKTAKAENKRLFIEFTAEW